MEKFRMLLVRQIVRKLIKLKTTRRNSTCILLYVCVVIICATYTWKRTMKFGVSFATEKHSKNLHLVRDVLHTDRKYEERDDEENPKSYKVDTDKSGRFGIVRDVFVAEKSPLNHDVSLITHCDGTRLKNVIDLANTWEGPIQIAVFLTSHELWKTTVKVINDIREHNIYAKQYVTWHILFPRKKNYHEIKPSSENKVIFTAKNILLPDMIWETEMDLLTKLGNLQKEIVELSLNGSTAEHIAFYPHTIAMNVAFNACRTEFLLSTDSDLIPSEGLRKTFVKFAESLNLYGPAQNVNPYSKVRKNNRTISDKNSSGNGICNIHINNDTPLPDMYVIPAFQSKSPNIPRTLPTLREAIKAGTAARFFDGMDGFSYRPTNHDIWLAFTEDEKVECFYEVKYSLLYEPFVIARRGIPPYDERFSGWSEVESHHKLLLHVLGYKYFVMKNVFLVHKGWKYKTDTSQQKIEEHEAHSEQWEDFLNDLSML